MILYVHGIEDFLADEAMKEVLDQADEVRRVDKLTEDDASWVGEADIFGDKKALVWTVSELKNDDRIRSLIEEAAAGTIVVRVLGGRSDLRISKWLKEKGRFVSANRLTGTEFSAFIRKWTERLGITGEVSYIEERCCYGASDDVNLYRVHGWLRQLALFDRCGREEIDAVINAHAEQKAFDLARMIGANKRATAVSYAAEVANKEVIPVLSAIQWSIRVAAKLKLFKPSEIGVSDWQAGNLKSLSGRDVDRMHGIVTDAIMAVKEGGNPHDIMVRTVAELLEGGV